MKKIVILQSNYIPWKGYFDIINAVDEFVLYDDMQYTRRDWRNRNMVKTAQGVRWITIPVEVKGRYDQRICDTRVADSSWAKSHFNTLLHGYAKAKHFDLYHDDFKALYEEASNIELLSEINYLFIKYICAELKITTPFIWSTALDAKGVKSDRLLDICLQLKATKYISGVAASCYLDTELFKSNGIEVEFFEYPVYSEYEQLYPPFTHTVSVLDLFVHTGKAARDYVFSK